MVNRRSRRLIIATATAAVVTIAVVVVLAWPSQAPPSAGAQPTGAPAPSAGARPLGAPDPSGYFRTVLPGSWRSLPGDSECAADVHRSPWEPRPQNYTPNNTKPPLAAVQQALASRPREVTDGYDRHWNAWLLPRVTGQHTGTTDENIQWAACKWGLSDNLLRAIAFRESTWVQYAVYPSGRCVETFGCSDIVPTSSSATRVYCEAISQYGYDYRQDYPPGICPETFSIAGVKAWEAPEWDRMADNQNGTFPFSRDSTAYALDYLGSYLRGCLEGWLDWLGDNGSGYRAGDIWGCVGSWYSGDWKSAGARDYNGKVRTALNQRIWLTAGFQHFEPACSQDFGCPRGL